MRKGFELHFPVLDCTSQQQCIFLNSRKKRTSASLKCVPDIINLIDVAPTVSEARCVFISEWAGLLKNNLTNTGKEFSGKHFPEDGGCSKKAYSSERLHSLMFQDFGDFYLTKLCDSTTTNLYSFHSLI